MFAQMKIFQDTPHVSQQNYMPIVFNTTLKVTKFNTCLLNCHMMFRGFNTDGRLILSSIVKNYSKSQSDE